VVVYRPDLRREEAERQARNLHVKPRDPHLRISMRSLSSRQEALTQPSGALWIGRNGFPRQNAELSSLAAGCTGLADSGGMSTLNPAFLHAMKYGDAPCSDHRSDNLKMPFPCSLCSPPTPLTLYFLRPRQRAKLYFRGGSFTSPTDPSPLPPTRKSGTFIGYQPAEYNFHRDGFQLPRNPPRNGGLFDCRMCSTCHGWPSPRLLTC
jgi:hypothetical protein